MNSRLLYVYAMAKTLYEHMGNYVDTFCVFVLKVLPTNKIGIDLNEIQKRIKDIFGLFIPEFSLKAIITRSKKRGYTVEAKKNVALTDAGDRYIEKLEPESNVNRRINELLDGIRSYLNKPELTLEETYKIVVCFINENMTPLIEFFDPAGKCRLNIHNAKIREYEGKLVEYFKIINTKEPALYRTLQDIVYGSIISLSAISSNISEINKKFKDVQVFLDSNIIFSLFELHYPEADKPVKELYELLRKYKFGLKVFDFTVNEMVHVLNNYSNEQYMYFPGVRVNSIYSNLKNKGWTESDVREFIQKIEERIWNLGIEICPSDVDINSYLPKKEYVDKIKKYKPLQAYQTEQGYYHDLAVIDKIKEIRGTPKREIERSSAIFLTSDLRLSKFDFLELHHKDNATVCEIIPDRLLTNILWLKSPLLIKEVPLQAIIAMHSHGIFIDQKIWKKFYNNIKKLKDEKRISEKDLAMLFYSQHIEEVLLEFGEEDIESITPKLIFDEIENARKKIDVETQQKLETQKAIFEDRISSELQKQKEWEDKFNNIKTKAKQVSRRQAERITNLEIRILYFLIAGIVICLFINLPGIIRYWVAPTVGILGFFGIKADIKEARSKSINEKFNSIYRKKLHELEIE